MGLGETDGFWIQTLVLAVSAIAGILVITSRGKQEKRRATVDLIVDQKRDPELTDARRRIREMHDRKDTNLSRHLQDIECQEYKDILLALNTYEFVASGIRIGAFSEEMYKRLRCSVLLKDWEAFKGFVIEFRIQKQIPGLFQDFEWLYKRWKTKPLKADSKL